jgi:hypothetical protein
MTLRIESWLDDLEEEIKSWKKLEVNQVEKFFVLNKMAQNLLTLAARIMEDPRGKTEEGSREQISCNLMVYEPEKDRLRLILTHGFYYKSAFGTVFWLKPHKGKDRRGSCGRAFLDKEIVVIDTPKELLHYPHIKRHQDDTSSVINIPLVTPSAKLGVLNIDSPFPNSFKPPDEYTQRAKDIQRVAIEYMQLYTAANPFLDQYRPSKLRDLLDDAIPQDVLQELALIERCFILGIPEAALFISRRTVERICTCLGVEPTNRLMLARAIDKLSQQGTLTEETRNAFDDINRDAKEYAVHTARKHTAQSTRKAADRSFKLLQKAIATIKFPTS